MLNRHPKMWGQLSVRPEKDDHNILDARYTDVAVEARIGLQSVGLTPERSQAIGGGREHADEENRGKRPSLQYQGQKRNRRNGGRAMISFACGFQRGVAAIRPNRDTSRCEGAFRFGDTQWTSLLRTASGGQESSSYEHYGD